MSLNADLRLAIKVYMASRTDRHACAALRRLADDPDAASIFEKVDRSRWDMVLWHVVHANMVFRHLQSWPRPISEPPYKALNTICRFLKNDRYAVNIMRQAFTMQVDLDRDTRAGLPRQRGPVPARSAVCWWLKERLRPRLSYADIATLAEAATDMSVTVDTVNHARRRNRPASESP